MEDSSIENESDATKKAKDRRKNAPQWKKSLAKELLKQKKKRFPRRRVYSSKVDSILAADLVDVHRYAKQNKNNTFILVVIDVFSKKAWARGLKTKSGPNTAKALKDILDGNKLKPEKLWTDKGSEFYNSNVAKVLKDKSIEIYSTHNDVKSAIAERFIRTLRKKIESNFILTNSTEWINILPQLIYEYNHTKHRSIGMSPESARKPENFKKVYAKLYGTSQKDLLKVSEKDRLPSFHVGDRVRISLHKRTFEKDSTANFSEEIYEISKVVQTTQPVTYKIRDLAGEDIEGSFYREQLLKTEQTIYRVDRILRRRTGRDGKAEVYVKWMGYPSKFNSWEPADQILKSDQ